MKASELRIGNLIWHDKIQKEDKSCVVTGVMSDSVWVKYSFQDQLGSNEICIDCKREAKPIPLTEEWLIKFGYTVQDKIIAWGKSTDIRHISISPSIYLCYNDRTEYNREGWYLCFFAEDEAMPEDMELAPIEYVHDFQNAVFALIREELTIKEQ